MRWRRISNKLRTTSTWDLNWQSHTDNSNEGLKPVLDLSGGCWLTPLWSLSTPKFVLIPEKIVWFSHKSTTVFNRIRLSSTEFVLHCFNKLCIFATIHAACCFIPSFAFDNWSCPLQMMSALNFLNTIMQFPKDTINDETVELMQPYLQREDYNREKAYSACGSVAGLCEWTTAMAFYFGINKEVLPLKVLNTTHFLLVVCWGYFQSSDFRRFN